MEPIKISKKLQVEVLEFLEQFENHTMDIDILTQEQVNAVRFILNLWFSKYSFWKDFL